MTIRWIHDHTLPAEALVEFQLEFARHCLDNTQELIRFMDQKAGYLLTAVGVLTAAVGTLAGWVFNNHLFSHHPGGLAITVGSLTLIYALLAFVVIYLATRVFAARPHTLRPDSPAPGLLFPLILLQRFQDNEDLYLEKLLNSTPRDLLHDYANSMLETSNIYRAKQALINRSVHCFKGLCVVWLLTVLGLLLVPYLVHA